jgi:hypothetical protein
MKTMITKPITAGLLLLLTPLSGLWLSSLGKPYNSGVFTIHKLIAVATVVIVAMNIYRFSTSIGLRRSIEIGVVAVIGLLFLALIVTGGLLSLDIHLRGIPLIVHQVAPLLALISTSGIIFMLTRVKAL